jgi:hypothetical protein
MCGSAQKVRNIRGTNASTCICAHTLIKCDPHAIAGRRYCEIVQNHFRNAGCISPMVTFSGVSPAMVTSMISPGSTGPTPAGVPV